MSLKNKFPFQSQYVQQEPSTFFIPNPQKHKFSAPKFAFFTESHRHNHLINVQSDQLNAKQQQDLAFRNLTWNKYPYHQEKIFIFLYEKQYTLSCKNVCTGIIPLPPKSQIDQKR